MKIKISTNPEFDFAIGNVGGFDDIPTKQDKFKPLSYSKAVLTHEDDSTTEIPINSLYQLSEKRRVSQAKFEDSLRELLREQADESHPYKKPQQLEVLIGVNMSTKRLKNVDIDNLAKCILDCLNGIIYEDDSQIASLTASKNVMEDNIVPQLSGVWIGVRKLSKTRPILNHVPLFVMEPIDEEE